MPYKAAKATILDADRYFVIPELVVLLLVDLVYRCIWRVE